MKDQTAGLPYLQVSTYTASGPEPDYRIRMVINWPRRIQILTTAYKTFFSIATKPTTYRIQIRPDPELVGLLDPDPILGFMDRRTRIR
jgi:hypothetical protein